MVTAFVFGLITAAAVATATQGFSPAAAVETLVSAVLVAATTAIVQAWSTRRSSDAALRRELAEARTELEGRK
jgi:hypothetical protein